jgi:hypothetical protein
MLTRRSRWAQSAFGLPRTRHRIPGVWSSVRISRFRDGFARHSRLFRPSRGVKPAMGV